MTRALRIRHATVGRAEQADYVRAVHELAVEGERTGRRVWLFQRIGSPDRFVEFIEGSRATLSDWSVEEHALLDRLDELASYVADASDTWIEVPAPEITGEGA